VNTRVFTISPKGVVATGHFSTGPSPTGQPSAVRRQKKWLVLLQTWELAL
jgi:hypothetical protein